MHPTATPQYMERDEYASDMAALLAEMGALGRRAGFAAVFRETSAQHFDAPSGDYHDAIKRNPSLVVVRAPRKQRLRTTHNRTPDGRDSGSSHPSVEEFLGPSFCRAHASPAHARSWHNQVVHELVATAPHAAAVAIQPFEQLTSGLWAFHAHPVHRGGKWVTDCTHFCYSPRFWDRSFHDLYIALSDAFQMRSKRGHVAGGATPWGPADAVRKGTGETRLGW